MKPQRYEDGGEHPPPGTYSRTVPRSCVQRTCNSAKRILDDENSQQTSFQIRKGGAPGKSRTCDLLVRRLESQNPNCLIVITGASYSENCPSVGLQMGWKTGDHAREDCLSRANLNPRLPIPNFRDISGRIQPRQGLLRLTLANPFAPRTKLEAERLCHFFRTALKRPFANFLSTQLRGNNYRTIPQSL